MHEDAVYMQCNELVTSARLDAKDVHESWHSKGCFN